MLTLAAKQALKASSGIYRINRHIISPAVSECTEAPTLSPKSSISNLSLSSRSSALSLRSDNRSILQTLEEAQDALSTNDGQVKDDASATGEANQAYDDTSTLGETPSAAGFPPETVPYPPLPEEKEYWKEDMQQWSQTIRIPARSQTGDVEREEGVSTKIASELPESRDRPAASSTGAGDARAAIEYPASPTTSSATLSSTRSPSRRSRPPSALKVRHQRAASLGGIDEASGKQSVAAELQMAISKSEKDTSQQIIGSPPQEDPDSSLSKHRAGTPKPLGTPPTTALPAIVIRRPDGSRKLMNNDGQTVVSLSPSLKSRSTQGSPVADKRHSRRRKKSPSFIDAEEEERRREKESKQRAKSEKYMEQAENVLYRKEVSCLLNHHLFALYMG